MQSTARNTHWGENRARTGEEIKEVRVWALVGEWERDLDQWELTEKEGSGSYSKKYNRREFEVMDGLLSEVVNILKIGSIGCGSASLQADGIKPQAFDKPRPPCL